MSDKELIKMIVDVSEIGANTAQLMKQIATKCNNMERTHQDQLDALYKRVQALEKPEYQIPMYEERVMPTNEPGVVRRNIMICGVPLDHHSKWELAQIIKHQAEQLENIWNQ